MGESRDLNIHYAFLATAVLLFVSSGCIATRTYTVVKERPDQEITGNQGYLMGGPTEVKEREIKTRKTYVMEVELGKPVKAEKKTAEGSDAGLSDISEQAVVYEGDKTEAGEMSTPVSEEKKVERIKTYKVQKGDTLEKIAARPEIYGNKKKWYRIYKANKGKLGTPNKIYPGQVLQIPE